MARKDASSAPDALVLINEDLLRFQITVASFCRTYLSTVGSFAILAGYGKIEAKFFPFDYPDPGAIGVTGAGVKDRANHLALTASGAFLLVDD